MRKCVASEGPVDVIGFICDSDFALFCSSLPADVSRSEERREGKSVSVRVDRRGRRQNQVKYLERSYRSFPISET